MNGINLKSTFKVFLTISLLAATCARIAYSGWLSPLFMFSMRGDGVRGIFSGVDGYFLPGPLRASTLMILNHPYPSVTFYYSIFHPVCMTGFLDVLLSAAAHISMILIILISLSMFDLPRRKIAFAIMMFIAIFNWAPFYDGVLQGFPPEFIEALGIFLGFYLFLRGRPISAGVVYGLTSTIKVLPVVFIIYFAYKKQFRLVITAMVTCLILSAAILFKENFNPNLLSSIMDSMGRGSTYGHSARDPGLSAFTDFIFNRSLGSNVLAGIHYAACFMLTLFFIAVERGIAIEKDRYLFGLAVISLAIFQASPRISEMYWYILLLPTLIFNIWMLIRYRDKLLGATFLCSYIFMHGFSLLNIIFKTIRHFINGGAAGIDPYLYFNEHGGIFIGVWLLFFSTYGFALKYLIPGEKAA
jgi:hypothetical protein